MIKFYLKITETQKYGLYQHQLHRNIKLKTLLKKDLRWLTTQTSQSWTINLYLITCLPDRKQNFFSLQKECTGTNFWAADTCDWN